MIAFDIRIIRERAGEGVGAEYKVEFGERLPTETELTALSVYFGPRLEQMARSVLGMQPEWRIAFPPKKP